MNDSVSKDVEGVTSEKKAPAQQSPQVENSISSPSPLELEVYKILATLFNSEETSFWTRNNILVAIQGGLIAATAAILGGAGKVLTPGAPAIATILLFGALALLSFVGLCMAITWLFMAGRSERIADTISEQLKIIERDFASRSSISLRSIYQAFITFDDNLDTKTSKQTLSPRNKSNNIRLSVLWCRVGKGLICLWAILLLVFIGLGCVLRPPVLPVESDTVLRDSFERITLAAEQIALQSERAAKAAEEAAIAAKKATEYGKKSKADLSRHRIKKDPKL